MFFSTLRRQRRNTHVWAVSVLAVLFGFAAASGCGDSGDSDRADAGMDGRDGGASTPDSGAGTEFVLPECPEQEKGIFRDAIAHWLDAGTIAYPADGAADRFELHYADCGLRVLSGQVLGSDGAIVLTENGELPAAYTQRYPHLSNYRALQISPADQEKIPDIIKGQVILVVKNVQGIVRLATRLQIPGVLDDLFAYDGALGITFADKRATFRLWAPTALGVRLHIFAADGIMEGAEPIATVGMTRGQEGVFTYENAPAEWYGLYYRYEVGVFSPAGRDYPGQNFVTDPYSVGLAANGRYSLIMDLDDEVTKPAGWDSVAKPGFASPEDIIAYGVHIRDFSAHDDSVPAEHRGTYLAFTYDGTDGLPLSRGMSHLIELQRAGLTHLQLYPVADMARVNEQAAARIDLDAAVETLCAASVQVPADFCAIYAGSAIRDALASFPPASGDAQELTGYLSALDGFDLGYGPQHYSVPEGSYATDPQGVARIVELRRMIQALARNGLGVMLDTSYGNTYASGFMNDASVLDRIVPGYYHRLNPVTGEVEDSTSFANTATEHAMMEKLFIDSLVLWAKQYKVDGFRLYRMGHQMKASVLAAKTALASLTEAADGVNGASIYLYGDGLDEGELQENARGQNAAQLNMADSGIGTLNDRLYDAVRGGNQDDEGTELRVSQGYITGMFYEANELNTAPASAQRDALLVQADMIRVGLAGNLRDFILIDRTGNVVDGAALRYRGKSVGYTADPQESIINVSGHEDYTLFDISQYKLRQGTPMATRVRVQNLGTSIALLAQGIPLLPMGQDFLRSKSMEKYSERSGDWFRKVDFSFQSNNWNVGLPAADVHGSAWTLIQSILADATIAPEPAHMQAAAAHTREMIAIRKSSKLFRLETREQVRRRVDFHNTGPTQTPGLIAMSITDGTCAGNELDSTWSSVLVLINATPDQQTLVISGASGFVLHPVLADSADAVVRTASFQDQADRFTVPARTTAVFVQPQSGGQGAGLPCNTKVIASGGGLVAPIFVVGSMNNFQARPEGLLVQDPALASVYRVQMPLNAGTYQFRIASADGTTHRWGIDGGTIPVDGSTTTYSLFPDAGNITLLVPFTVNVQFVLNVANFDSPTLAVGPVF